MNAFPHMHVFLLIARPALYLVSIHSSDTVTKLLLYFFLLSCFLLPLLLLKNGAPSSHLLNLSQAALVALCTQQNPRSLAHKQSLLM